LVGRITAQKGLDHLIAAGRFIAPRAQLILCAGTPDTPEIARRTREAVDDLVKERDGVHWIEDSLPRNEIVQLLSHATVFVCPSVYEPFGLINLEAMACSIPVVASAVGGIPEIVEDGRTGLLVPLGSDLDRFERDLAVAINELLANPQRAKEMGIAGRRRVLESFTWDVAAQRTHRLYQSLLPH
jgi:alpha-maltose-1-phosphate synthase